MSPARPDSTRLPSPQRPRLFLSDGGLETTMIFREGLDLPCFASFTGHFYKVDSVSILAHWYHLAVLIFHRSAQQRLSQCI